MDGVLDYLGRFLVEIDAGCSVDVEVLKVVLEVHGFLGEGVLSGGEAEVGVKAFDVEFFCFPVLFAEDDLVLESFFDVEGFGSGASFAGAAGDDEADFLKLVDVVADGSGGFAEFGGDFSNCDWFIGGDGGEDF